LRSALIELGEVEHAMEDVMGLLQQVEADLQQFGDVYGDPRHIEVHLRKIQARSIHVCLFTAWVGWYQKCKPSLDLNEARDDGVLGCNGIS